MTKDEKLMEHIKASPFHRSASYSVNIDLYNFDQSLLMYNDILEEQAAKSNMLPSETVKALTPVFQRENTKWSQKMQIKFMENLISGCPTTVQLFSIKSDIDSELGNCSILDGLQRSTAISAFQEDKYPIFGDIYFSDISRKRIRNMRLKLSIYTFQDEIEAVEFYIQMNEGITHSEKDMLSAYEYLEKLKCEQATKREVIG